MEKIIGIDLGTTNSLAAFFEGNACQTITNTEGHALTPSVVGFTTAGEALVGQVAKRQAIAHPERTVVSIKRRMGADSKVTIGDREYTPQEISAMILQKLKMDAEKFFGAPIKKAVITVPAYFNDSERQATKDAGAIAGLEVVRIINEPTAAAMAYGLNKIQGTQNVLVFDLGGGTFDVSVLTIEQGVFEVIATSGDMKLGGDDWDERIINYAIEEFKKSGGRDLRTDPLAMQRLKEISESAKWELSEKETTRINLPFVTTDASGGPQHLDLELTRQQFEELTKDLVERLAIPAKKALNDAKIPLGQIHQVILVGGATRMPMVQKMAQKLFLKPPAKEVDPDKVVAMGAAIQGAIIAGETQDLVLLDVAGLALGIETTGGAFNRIIERNTQIPCSKAKMFTTVSDNQTTVEVRVYQGEREIAHENKFLGNFELSNIPPAAKGVPQIEVLFEIDVNGIVSVSAKDLATGNRRKIMLESPNRLTQEEIRRMIQDAAQHAREDAATHEACLIRNKALVEIDVAERAVKDYSTFFNREELAKIQNLVTQLKKAISDNDLESARQETNALEEVVFGATAQLYAVAKSEYES